MLYKYELALILSAKLTDEKQKKILDEVNKQVGGKPEVKPLGKKNFAYPIKRETEGFYYILKFPLLGNETKGVSKKLSLNEGILRFLLIRRK